VRGLFEASLRPSGPLGALRSPNFRLFWTASMAAFTGHHIRIFAQPYLVYQLTGSPLLLGITGAFVALPAIAFTFPAGALADRMDRRLLIMLAQGLAGVLTLVLALDVALGWVEVWHVWAFAFILGIYWAFERPARQAIIPSLLDSREALPSAIALNSILWQMGRIVGPGLAGAVIALGGVAAPFFLTASGFLLLLLALRRLPKMPPPQPKARRSMAEDLWEGFQFIGRDPVFFTLIGLSIYAGFFGLVYVQFLAVFADEHGVGAVQFGLMGTVIGIGAVLGGTTVAFLGKRIQQGQLLLGSGVAFGLSLTAFAQAPTFPMALALLATTGFTVSFFHVGIQTVLQILVPDALRGRVMAIQSLNLDMNHLGATPLGATADQIGIRATVAIWGLLVAGGAIVAAVVPQVRRLREQPSPERV